MTTSIFTPRMFLALVKISGRDPAQYSVSEVDGRVYVHGPCASAGYSGFHWISQFSRDLYSGFFERPAPQMGTNAVPSLERVLH